MQLSAITTAVADPAGELRKQNTNHELREAVGEAVRTLGDYPSSHRAVDIVSAVQNKAGELSG
jgi:hypothetical protein